MSAETIEPTPDVGAGPEVDDTETAPPKKSAATQLVELAEAYYRVFADESGAPFAVEIDGPNLAMPLRGSHGLRQRLARRYFDEYERAASAAALADALAVLEGKALDDEREPVALRIERDDESVVIDLGTADGRCVIVSPGGWTVADRSPVLFRRTALTGAMPTPERGGSVDALAALVNADADTVRLIVGWLVAALIPEIDHPILGVFGEQGTAKTTMLRLLVGLIDPSPAPTRTAPRDTGGWAVTASASWVVGLDNISTIPEWLSDSLCKAVTGDGVVNRALYTDSDVSVLAFRRVIAMTSIDAGALRGDLGDRLLPIELQRIERTARRSATEVNARAADAVPAVLGALLDLLAAVLVAMPHVQTTELPRMADFARVLAALDAVTGWHTVADYAETAEGIAESVIDSDPFAVAIRDLVLPGAVWRSTADELLNEISPDPKPRGWPKAANSLVGRLKRIVPALRELGVSVEFTREPGGTRARKVTIARAAVADETAPENTRNGSSRPSPSSREGSDQGVPRDDAAGRSGTMRDGLGGIVPGSSRGSSLPLRRSDLPEYSGRDGRDDRDGLSHTSSHVRTDSEPANTHSHSAGRPAVGKLSGFALPSPVVRFVEDGPDAEGPTVLAPADDDPELNRLYPATGRAS